MNLDAMIITVNEWTMAPDGEEYRYFWSPRWKIITDKEVPVEGFRSTEKWQLIALVGGNEYAYFPGCQVKALVRTKRQPQRKHIYCFGD